MVLACCSFLWRLVFLMSLWVAISMASTYMSGHEDKKKNSLQVERQSPQMPGNWGLIYLRDWLVQNHPLEEWVDSWLILRMVDSWLFDEWHLQVVGISYGYLGLLWIGRSSGWWDHGWRLHKQNVIERWQFRPIRGFLESASSLYHAHIASYNPWTQWLLPGGIFLGCWCLHLLAYRCFAFSRNWGFTIRWVLLTLGWSSKLYLC